MQALIYQDKVIQIENESFPVNPSLRWMAAPEGCQVGWQLVAGVLQAPAIPTPDLTDYAKSLKQLLNRKAAEKEYDDEQSIVSYKDSAVKIWAQEAADFIAWRDSCWQYAIEVQRQVEAQEIEPPTLDDFILNAPELIWS